MKPDNVLPEIVASIERPWGLASNGKSVAIASLLGVVELFDVSSEGVVKPKAKIQFPDLDKGDIRGVAFVGDYLVVALADRQLRTFTIAGERVFESSSLKLPGVPYS
ncbi:MAG: hypothetical protein GWO23_10050, partial [Gammaproteobacteria bacterium]|nr:hypothetical protein [Gammaproteobacteria bacterium]